jgi:parallel beta-helix repeat protein
MKIFPQTIGVFVALLILGCNDSPPASSENSNDIANGPQSTNQAEAAPDDEAVRTVIKPGPNAQSQAQEALILAEPGDVIEFAQGTFNFNGTLTVDGATGITVKGKGMDKTILNFSKVQPGKGGEGMRVKANDFTIEDLTLEDTPGDAIKLQDCNNLTIRRVKTWWTGGPATENGAYGIYPVLSTNVLIEDCFAEGASDAGIYVGQSKQVIVRNCEAVRNVAGIEIENCIGADVYNNVAKNNTGGILVFSLPGLTIKNGSDCRVFGNTLSSNNHPNFAKEGAIVSTVPPGTGLMVMANDRVELFENKFENNDGASCLIVSFLVAQRKYDDAEYDPFPEAISIHDNTFADGGKSPQGEFLEAYSKVTGQPLPDIVFDGILDSAKLVDGKLPSELGFSITNNGSATFVNLDLGKSMAGAEPNVSIDMTPYAGELPAVKPVNIQGTE